MTPHWEHGYRCHGYWLGAKRIGFIGIQPGYAAAKKHGYRWFFELPTITNNASGWNPNLRSAKRAVETAYKQYLEKNKQ